MKAYIVAIKGNDDAGNEIVFADNIKDAKKEALGTQVAESADSFIDITVKRYPALDDYENKTDKEQKLVLFREGWWFEVGTPCNEEQDESNVTDEQFYAWYEKNIEK